MKNLKNIYKRLQISSKFLHEDPVNLSDNKMFNIPTNIINGINIINHTAERSVK